MPCAETDLFLVNTQPLKDFGEGPFVTCSYFQILVYRKMFFFGYLIQLRRVPSLSTNTFLFNASMHSMYSCCSPSGLYSIFYAVAGAILTGYGVLILGAVIKSKISGSAPEPEPVVEVVEVASTGDLPSIESPEFEKFIETADDAAIMKWIDSASN